MIKMPVHLAYDQRTLIEKELDHFVDSKGCLQACQTLHRLEPVCCCERCYACLANPLIGKLSEKDWSNDQEIAAQDDDVLLTDSEWFSMYACSSCSCECCSGDCRKLCGGRKDERRLETAPVTADSPPLNKKRMTSSSPADRQLLCPKYGGVRRPLVDLQLDADDDDAVKRADSCVTNRSSWLRDGHELSRDETHSWVQPPPNRTICHIVDDVTLERLASSSPMLTRCCLTSNKHGTGRHTRKTKAKNQPVSR